MNRVMWICAGEHVLRESIEGSYLADCGCNGCRATNIFCSAEDFDLRIRSWLSRTPASFILPLFTTVRAHCVHQRQV